ncbi:MULTISPECIES: bifunctional riboflavin kinase/FAD synthetase [unclassified Guyparkeria]|uniref:bifunctional riboflavin kinase/FAD synthetase n=1 Tax=unclassified Guyparkeria TaxID=2626246 RepID=UPI0007334DAF|nr:MULTISPECIES: bifunctional riboflavin kinase/FAD synthetase [unclassified Guyparkeria]KTG17021.1 bifunctional riboflavin kinase/FMN adenylyltransferase [Guyparkeria sp. XI15]OAE86055.1 bifunctional riboflavin kinase/FMN adenylyltransferase [Guyparkeria sp. WRN-7]
MQLSRLSPSTPPRLPADAPGTVVTIGNFDGVHRGHRAVILQAAEQARSLGLPLTVVIFEPLPREFFAERHGVTPVARLTRLRERFQAFEALDVVDRLVLMPFNATLAGMPASNFVKELLIGALGARHVVIGDDFRFGVRRAGDFTLLERMGSELGFGVERAVTVTLDGERVSSTRVRAALEVRDVATAAQLLGHPFFLCGRVMHGDKRGRQLGFPTANIALRRRLSPLRGVFLVRMSGTDGGPRYGVANIGTRPTVDGGEARLEVFVLDFDGDLYGELVTVEFLADIRDERRFESLDALVEQIRADVDEARRLIDTYRAGTPWPVDEGESK